MKKYIEKPLALLLSLCLTLCLFAGCGLNGETLEISGKDLQSPAGTAWEIESAVYHFFPDGAMVIWLDGAVYYGAYQWEDSTGSAWVEEQTVGLRMEKKGLAMEDLDGKYSLMSYAGTAGGEQDAQYEALAESSWEYNNVVYTFCADGTVECVDLAEGALPFNGKYYWNCDLDRGILILAQGLAAEIYLEEGQLVFALQDGGSYPLQAYTGTFPD